MRDIRDLSLKEFKSFVDSFDFIFSDCDGVLWLNEVPIKDALQTLEVLERLGKKIIFVSNNTSRSVNDYLKKLQAIGYKATPDQIMLPAYAIIGHLQRIKFKGKAFVVGTTVFLEALRSAGINVVHGPNSIAENLSAIHDALRGDNEVKAVIFDFDINLSWVKMIQASAFLERDDVLFFTGPGDKKLPISETRQLIGPGNYIDILVNHTKRKPIDFAKPSVLLKDALLERYQVSNPKRCIFVGDCLATDMKFAELCGFQKMWVSSGVDPANSINSSSEILPNYYLPNLGALLPLVKRIVDDQCNNNES